MGDDPFIVARQSDRLGDEWQRGFIIDMADCCKALFGKKMLGVVATMANVAFVRTDLTEDRKYAGFFVVPPELRGGRRGGGGGGGRGRGPYAGEVTRRFLATIGDFGSVVLFPADGRLCRDHRDFARRFGARLAGAWGEQAVIIVGRAPSPAASRWA